jgi:hypothetical protein
MWFRVRLSTHRITNPLSPFLRSLHQVVYIIPQRGGCGAWGWRFDQWFGLHFDDVVTEDCCTRRCFNGVYVCYEVG